MSQVPPSAVNLRGAVDLSSLIRPTTAPPVGASASGQPAAPAGPVSVPSLVVEANDASFTSILDLSRTVPVVVELYAGEPTESLIRLVTGYGGRLVLATIDASTSPQLQQAFRAQVVPTVAAVVGGRRIELYEGELPEAEARQVLEQLLALAVQNGVTGSVTPTDAADDATADADAADAVPAEPAEEPLPPLHQEAYDAIDRGDYPGAVDAYRRAIAQDPRDQLAVAGLAQVSLLDRLADTSADEVRAAAASAPRDVDAQLAVADLDVSGGHLDDAFDRLLTLFPSLDADRKALVRTRILEYFEIAGNDDPRVGAARRRLTGLLY